MELARTFGLFVLTGIGRDRWLLASLAVVTAGRGRLAAVTSGGQLGCFRLAADAAPGGQRSRVRGLRRRLCGFRQCGWCCWPRWPTRCCSAAEVTRGRQHHTLETH